MAIVLTYGASMPVVKLARIAGQYAKPRCGRDRTRSASRRTAGTWSTTSPSTAEARPPDPRRLLRAYQTAAATLNLLRAFATGGEPTCARCTTGTRTSSAPRRPAPRYEQLAPRSTGRWTSCGPAGCRPESLLTASSSTARHEALLLEYERALTRPDVGSRRAYDLSGALRLDRRPHPRARTARTSTSSSRIANPIGMKVGPTATPDEVAELVERLDPDGDPGPAHADHPDGRPQVRDRCRR